MGNKASATTHENNESPDVDWHGLTTKHLEFYEEKMKSVDDSMTSLACSLDAMHAAVLKENQKSKQASAAENVRRNEMDDLTLKLLLKIEQTVLHNKESAVNSLREFLHYTSECITLFNKTEINDSQKFSLDKYASVPNELRQNRPNIEMRIEKAMVENERLKEDLKRCYTREKKFDEEKQIILQKTKKIEKLNDTLRSQKDEKERNISELKSLLNNMKSEIKKQQQLSDELENVRLTNDALNRRIENLDSENAILLAAKSDNIQEIKSFKSENSEKSSKIETLNKKVSKLQNKYDNLKTEKEREKMESQELVTKEKNEIDIQNSKTLDELKSANQQLVEINKEQTQQLELKENDIEAAKAETDRLKTDIKEIRDQNEKMQADLKKVELESKTLFRDLKISTNTHEQFKIDLQTKERDIISLQLKLGEAEKANASIVNLSAENKEIKCQREQAQNDLVNAKHAKKCLENELEEKELDLKSLQRQIKDEKEECRRLFEENEELNRTNTQLQETIKKTTDECKLKSQTLEKVDYERKCFKSERDEHSIRLQELEKKTKDLDKQLSTANHEIFKFTETIKQIEQRNETLKEENCSLKQELETFKRTKVIPVQIYYQRRGELTAAVEEELLCLLKSKMESSGKVELQFNKRLQAADVNPNTPLLLLCISASRIGTDAANTIHGLNLTSKMWLLIFHHKDVHALPSQASYQILTGKEYTSLGGICDLAFLTGKGLYSCPMNESSIDKIVNFIDTEGGPSSDEHY